MVIIKLRKKRKMNIDNGEESKRKRMKLIRDFVETKEREDSLFEELKEKYNNKVLILKNYNNLIEIMKKKKEDETTFEANYTVYTELVNMQMKHLGTLTDVIKELFEQKERVKEIVMPPNFIKVNEECPICCNKKTLYNFCKNACSMYVCYSCTKKSNGQCSQCDTDLYFKKCGVNCYFESCGPHCSIEDEK